MNKIIQTDTATFVVDIPNQVVVITQLSRKAITEVDAYILLSLLRTDFSEVNKKSLYCSKANRTLTLGANMHLRTNGHDVNTTLKGDTCKELIQCITGSFPNIEKTSELLSAPKQEVEIAKRQEHSNGERIQNLPLIETIDYDEPRWHDDNGCMGSPSSDFIGVKNLLGGELEISCHTHEMLFDPHDSNNIKGYYITTDFNLYDSRYKNFANKGHIVLKCSYNKSSKVFVVLLFTSKEFSYCETTIYPGKPIRLVVGKLPQAFNYKSSLTELLEETDDEELPWIE